MSSGEYFGTIGVALILLAYFFSVFNLIQREGRLFFIMNMLGAGLACYASYLIVYWPFVLLEGMWVVVSILGLTRYSRKK